MSVGPTGRQIYCAGKFIAPATGTSYDSRIIRSTRKSRSKAQAQAKEIVGREVAAKGTAAKLVLPKEGGAPGPPRDFKILLTHAAVAAALSVVILLAWSNSFGGAFVFDNRAMILVDARVQAATGENIGLILNHSYWNTKYDSGLYRPVTTLSYLFNYAILGNADHPAGYHWLNILLHILNAWLVYALAFHFLRKLWPAAFVAAVWSLHPIVTEAVTNIVGRADMLATLAVLGGFLLYLKSTESTDWRRLLWLGGLLAVTTLGVFSKESAVAILGVIVLYEWTWWRERKQLRGLLYGCAALLPPFLFLLYQRAAVLTTGPPPLSNFPENPIIGASFVSGRLTALTVMAKCLWLLVWPAKLSVDYSYNQIPIATGSAHDWLAWGALLGVAIAVAAAFKRNRVAFFFGAFWFVCFLPVSNLFFPIGTIMAERLLYMPSVGFAVCLVLLAYWVARKTCREALAPVALCAILLALGVRTWTRNADWHDNLSLWTSAVQAAPDSFKTHLNLASAIYDLNPDHLDLKQGNQITEEVEKAYAILAPLPDTMNSELAYAFGGRAYLIKGDLLQRPGANGQLTATPESRAAYQRSLEILTRGVAIDRAFNEGYRREELARGRSEAEIAPAGMESLYYALAADEIRLGKNDEAVTAASYSAMLAPQFPDAYVALGDALFAENRKEDAAISLMEGFLISGDRKFVPLLHTVYSSGIDAKGCSYTGGSQFPNPSCELVHSDYCKASSRLIQRLLDARQPSLASNIKDNATQQTGCSPDELK